MPEVSNSSAPKADTLGEGVFHRDMMTNGASKENNLRPIFIMLQSEGAHEYQPSPILIKQPPQWTKKFSGSIIAPVGDEKWKAVHPSMKGLDDFIPLELSEEERSTAAVELDVMKMLTKIRGRVESTEAMDEGMCDDDEEEEEEGEDLSLSEETDSEAVSAKESSPEELHSSVFKWMDEVKEEDTEEVEELEVVSSKKRKRNKTPQPDLRDKITNKRNGNGRNDRNRSIVSDDSSLSVCSAEYLSSSSRCEKLYDDLFDVALVSDELKCMQEKGVVTDCEFKVGNKTFKCHSTVLKRNENHLRELLLQGSVIEIENMRPEIFEIVLRYLYKGKVTFGSFEEAERVLCAAQILQLSELIKMCTMFCALQLRGDPNHFWAILDSLLQDQPEPYQIILCRVTNLTELLKCKEFLDISVNTLHFIVEQRYVSHCCEKTLIRAVEKWAVHHLQNIGIKPGFDNIRIVLGPVISKLRFLSIDQVQLVKVFKETNLLSEKEKLELLERSVTRIGKPLENLSPEKFSRDLDSSIRFYLPKCKSTKQLIIDSGSINCSFFFSPLEDILLINFQYFSQISRKSGSRQTYLEKFVAQVLRIEGDSKVEVLRELSAREDVQYDSILRVRLPVPVLLKKSRRYSYAIKLTLQTPGMYKVKDNFLLNLQEFDRKFLEPLRSDFSWGNDGIFASLNYKVLCC